MNVIIVEDEALARDILREYLESHPDVHIQAECDKAQKALQAIEEHGPDLIFLDIQLPDMNGFELLDQLSTLPYIIFTTAYDQYAIRAFEVNALDYLLKPFDQDRFDEALKRVKRQMEQAQFDR